jgi:hypothetical protein
MRKHIFATMVIVATMIMPQSFADTPNLSDTESARIDLIALSNQSIETSKASSELLITITASDNLNNIELVFQGVYRAASPFPVQANLFPMNTSNQPISTSVVNNRVVSVYQFKITIPKGLAPGDYYIYSFARDVVGNYPQTGPCDKYCNIAKMPDYPESRFVIKNDGTGNVIDVTQFDIAAKASAITVTNTALKATNADLQGQLTLASKSYSELQGQGVLLKSEIQELKSQNTVLQTSVSEFKSSLEVAASLKKSVDSNVISLSAKIKKICATKPKPKGC